MLTGGLAVLGGGACLAVAAANLRVIWRGQRELRGRVAAEDERVAELPGGGRAGRGGSPGRHRRDVQVWRERREVFGGSRSGSR